MKRRYEANPKHKRGACGSGPPRWFPSRDSLCPDDLDQDTAQSLLEDAISAPDKAHAGGKALYAMHEGNFYKAYSQGTEEDEDGTPIEVWHGYPVRRELVPTQVPCKVLREFVKQRRLSKPEYKKLLGSA